MVTSTSVRMQPFSLPIHGIHAQPATFHRSSYQNTAILFVPELQMDKSPLTVTGIKCKL